MCRAHIALQELQTITMMLHRMALHLPGKVFILHLDNITAKAYLCNQVGTVSPFLSRLACQILSLTDKHSINFIPAHIPTHLNVEADYLSQSQLLLEWHLLPPMAQAAFCHWDLPEVDLLIPPYIPMPALRLNAFSYPWMFQVRYVFPPPALVPLVLFKFLAEHVKGQLRLLIVMAPCWSEAPWLPTVLKMLADAPCHCPMIKDLMNLDRPKVLIFSK